MNNFFRNFLASLPPRLASQPAMDPTPAPHATQANPFSLDHECYADSRHFLQNKPLLRHIASQLETLKVEHPNGEEACVAFADAIDATDVSREETLEVEPLVALPDVAAIACRECGRFMPITESGVVRHVKKYHIGGDLTSNEGKELSGRVNDCLMKFGGITESGAWWIPHGIHFFPSLNLSLEGIACSMPNCGWLYVAGIKGKHHFKAGKQHLLDSHAKVVESEGSIRENLIYPLPMQRVEQLGSGSGFVYFVTSVPADWTSTLDPALRDGDGGGVEGGERKGHKVKKRRYEHRRTPEEREKRRRKKEKRRAAERMAAEEQGDV